MNESTQGLEPPSPGPPEGGSGRRSSWARRLVLLALVLALVGFYASGLQDRLDWEAFKAQRAQLQQTVNENLLSSLLIFFVIYVAVTGLSLPGATILSLAAGALLGRWLGTVFVSFASTTGATAAFLLTRYLFRDLVQTRFGTRLEPIDRGIEKDGAYYLFTLRLVPLFPFFLINAAMGLTRIRVWTFWWVSQLGMLPATFVYVNAGTEAGNINSPKDILSPGLLLSLALLGLLPLLSRLALKWWRAG